MHATRTKGDVLVEPIERLEQALAADCAGHERDWAQRVGNALGNIEQALGAHTALTESTDGLFSKVDLTRPTSVRQVSELRREHTELRDQTRTLRGQLQTGIEAFRPPDASLARVEALPEPTALTPVPDFGSIRQAVARLLADPQRHQRDETKLLLESVNNDIGVGD